MGYGLATLWELVASTIKLITCEERNKNERDKIEMAHSFAAVALDIYIIR